MRCTKKKCACELLKKTAEERAKCLYKIVPVSKFHGKRKRIKINPNTGKRIDNNQNDK